MSHDIWKAILNETGWTTIQLRDQRYDAVCHLVTAADGAEEFYGMNNEARYETPEQAREVDKKLLACYKGHPHFKICDNLTDFKSKIQSLVEFVAKSINLPVDGKIVAKKYLLDLDGGDILQIIPDEVQVESFEVEETFLNAKDPNIVENKIASRGKGDSYIYSHSVLTQIKGEDIKRKRQITAREYVQLSELKDPSKITVQKDRHCFLFNNNAFIVDVFKNLKRALCVLRVDADVTSKEFKLPPFLKILNDISADSFY